MKGAKAEVVQYRLLRAEETFSEALLLAKHEKWKGSINRLYYSCFYALTALLAHFNFEVHTHKGAKAIFHQHFLLKEIISGKAGLTFTRLFSSRQFGDYDDFYEIEEEFIQKFIPEVRSFINEIIELINNSSIDPNDP